jgi:GNAT superfamily N-acetyltransferase
MCSSDVPIPGYRIEHRPLAPEEARLLHEELKTTPNILGYTVRELVGARDVWVTTDAASGEFAGACLSFDLPFGWTEIAAVYVLPAHRGVGLGGVLLERAWARASGRGRHLYLLSRNPSVIAWMRARGMAMSENLLSAPLAAHLYTAVYMSSLHRNREAWRKRRDIAACPPLTQGVKRSAASRQT